MTEEPFEHHAYGGRYLVPAEQGPVCDNPDCSYHRMTILDRDLPALVLTYPAIDHEAAKYTGQQVHPANALFNVNQIRINRYLFLPGSLKPVDQTNYTINHPDRIWLCAACFTTCCARALSHVAFSRAKQAEVSKPPQLTKD